VGWVEVKFHLCEGWRYLSLISWPEPGLTNAVVIFVTIQHKHNIVLF
jgi:hypothetical protein